MANSPALAPAERAELLRIVEEQLVRRSFVEFLRRCQIEDAHRGLIAYEFWPHLEALARRLEAGQGVIILKSRQLGVSWLCAAYARWRAQYQPGSVVLELSQGQAEAYELLDKGRRIVGPAVPIERDRDGRIDYRDGGAIIALPATERAGRSYTASLVIADEAAYHPYAAENYAAYKPTLDGGGQLIVISTANGPSGWFYDMWRAAVRGESSLLPVFIPWDARPGRDAAWLAQQRADYGGLPAQFAREYPETAEGAFIAHSGLVYGMDEHGIRAFDPVRTVRPARASWAECRYRLAGLDPGGADPTGMVALGMGADDRMHIYGTRRLRGAQTLEALADYLSRWEGLNAVIVDAPPQSTIVATLRAMGINAHAAVKDKAFGIGLVSSMLRRGTLTVEPGQSELEQEFNSYWWAERRANQIGNTRQIQTLTPAEHHADLLDSLRYAVVAATQGAWRDDADRVATERWAKQEREARRTGGKVVPGWDVRGVAAPGQYR